MRALALASCAAALVVACSSSSPATGSAADAGNEYRGLGQSCDPSSPHPCEILTDACSVSECQAKVCVRVLVDAGPTCSNAAPPVYDAGAMDSGEGEGGGSVDGSVDGGDASFDASSTSDASSDAADAAAGD